MDEKLRRAYGELIAKYPPVVKVAIQRAMVKAHDVARQDRQHGIRDEILEAVEDGLSTDGVPDEDAIALILEHHGEDYSGSD